MGPSGLPPATSCWLRGALSGRRLQVNDALNRTRTQPQFALLSAADRYGHVRTRSPRRIIVAVTKAAQQLFDSFEALPEDEKHQALAQLLRRLMDTPYSSPSGEELLHAAGLVFQEYDRREARE